MVYSPPGFSDHGILQATILKWVAIPLFRGPSQPRDQARCPALQADSVPSEPLEAPSLPSSSQLSITHALDSRVYCAPYIRAQGWGCTLRLRPQRTAGPLGEDHLSPSLMPLHFCQRNERCLSHFLCLAASTRLALQCVPANSQLPISASLCLRALAPYVPETLGN